jgi:hypothetical protein
MAVIWALQPSQPLHRIINLSYPRVSVFLEVKGCSNNRLRNITLGQNLVEMKQRI